MAVRSIIDIDVNSGSFQAFSKVWNRYQQQLKASPSAWAQVSSKIGGTKKSFDELVAKMTAQNAQVKLMAIAQERADRNSHTMADSWRNISRSTKDTALHIKDMTASLLRWASLTTVFTGLLGAGGLFGIERLATGVSETRKSSRGLGVSFGEQKSFEANYKRFVDPDAFLATINQISSDISKSHVLPQMGLSRSQIDGRSPYEIARAVLPALKRDFQNVPDNQIQTQIDAKGIGEAVSVELIKTLKHTDWKELNQVGARADEYKKTLNLDDKTQSGFQELDTRLELAGKSIWNTFVVGLAPLTPSLTHLSQSFENLVGIFVREGGPLEKWVKELDASLQKFATYIGTPKFKTDVSEFVTNVGRMADTIASVVKWFSPGKNTEGKTEPSFADKVFGKDPNQSWFDTSKIRVPFGISGGAAPSVADLNAARAKRNTERRIRGSVPVPLSDATTADTDLPEERYITNKSDDRTRKWKVRVPQPDWTKGGAQGDQLQPVPKTQDRVLAPGQTSFRAINTSNTEVAIVITSTPGGNAIDIARQLVG